MVDLTPEQQAAIERAKQAQAAASTAPSVSTVDPQDRLLPEVRALGPNATDDQIRATLAARSASIAGQQAQEGYIPQGKEFVRSLGEGVARIPETLVAPFSNLGGLIAAGAQKLTGQPVAIAPPPTPISDTYNKVLPPDPNFPVTREVGNVAGPAIVEAFDPLAIRPPMSPAASTGRAAVQTGATIAGQQAGGAIGQAVGGDTGEKIGEGVGSVGGSVVAPAIVSTSARTLRPSLTDEDTPQRIQSFDATGVPVSMGGVGSKQAGFLEDSTAGIPLAGKPAYDMRRAQREAMDQNVINAASDVRGGPYQGPGISEANIGQDVIDAAKQAFETTKYKGDATLNPIYDQAGRNLPVDQTQELTTLEGIKRGEQPGYGRKGVQEIINRTNDTRLDPLNPPKVVDPGLEALLQTRLAQEQARLQNARTSGQAGTAQANIDAISQQIAANRGSTFQEVVDQRSRVGDQVEGLPAIDQPTQLDIKDAKTETLKNAAQLAGVPPAAFDAANAEYGRLAGQREILKPVAKNTNQGSAYTQVFGGSGKDNLTLQKALNENTPDPTMANILANNLELKMRGPGAAGSQTPDPEAVNPSAGLKFWQGLDDSIKSQIAPMGSAVRAKLDNLMTVYGSELRRPTRTLPGKGGNTMGGPLALLALMSGVGVGGGIVGGGTGTGLGALAPVAGTYLLSKALTNPNFTRMVANPPGFLPSSELTRLLTGAVAAQQGQ